MLTSLYAGICGFLLLALSLNVILGRRSLEVGLGDGQNTRLFRRIRAQANFVEYAPFFLVGMYLMETAGANSALLNALGWAFLAGRLSHAYGILFAEPQNLERGHGAVPFRQIGMVLTLACLITISSVLFLQSR